jgi:hypothetical protein
MKIRNLIVASLLSLSVLLFPGCASTTRTGNIASLAVQIGVIKVIGNNSAKAQRVAYIAQQVREIAGGKDFNTVALLIGYVNHEIKWETLSAEDQAIAHLLLNEIQLSLEEQLGTGTLSTDKLLIVSDLATWIEKAASGVVTLPTIGK